MFSMNALQRKRMIRLSAMACIAMVALVMILLALKQNINLYLTPSEVTQQIDTLQNEQVFRLGGLVVAGSHHESENLQHQFKLTDGTETIQVLYKGLLPDLFREKQGIVTQGYLKEKGIFIAEQVLAKHDENYHPPGLPKENVV